MQQPEQKPMQQKMEETFNLIWWATEILAICVLPFTRARWGISGIGTPGMWAMVFIPIYAGLMNEPLMLDFWYAFVGMAIYRRLTADREENRFFQGYVLFWWRVFDGYFTARLAEALTFLAISNFMPTEATTLFMRWSAGAVAIKLFLEWSIYRAEIRAIKDAEIDMELMQRRMDQARKGK